MTAKLNRHMFLILLSLWAQPFPAWGQTWETLFTLPPPEQPPFPTRVSVAILPDPLVAAGGASNVTVWMNSAEQDFYHVNLLDGSIQGQSITQTRVGVSAVARDRTEGRLFAVTGGECQVWTSADNGTSWTSLDCAAEGASSLALGASGEVFICGNTYSLDKFTSFVRKSSDHGVHWMTMNVTTNSSVQSIHFVPGEKGGIFTVGYRIVGANAYHAWTVRRSRDGGQTWQQVDSFTRPGKNTYATEIISDAQGRICVGGNSTPDPVRWEVRISEDGGDTWKTISPPGATALSNGSMNAMAIDPTGRLLVAGVLDAWAVAQRSPLGEWLEVEFPFGVESDWVSSGADALTVDGAGNVLVAGRIRSRSPDGVQSSLVIQRLATPPPAPTLTMTRSDGGIRLSWPASAIGFTLDSTDSMASPPNWQSEPTPPEVVGDQNVVTLEIDDSTKFFRLRKQ